MAKPGTVKSIKVLCKNLPNKLKKTVVPMSIMSIVLSAMATNCYSGWLLSIDNSINNSRFID